MKKIIIVLISCLILSLAINNTVLAEEETSLSEINIEDNHSEIDVVNDTNLQIPDDAVVFNGHSYYIYKQNSWKQAKQLFEEMGGHLATITSAEENSFLYQYYQRLVNESKCDYHGAYFGFSDIAKKDNWKWVTGEPVSYTNWNIGEPNFQGRYEYYGMFYYTFTKGEWNDGNGLYGDYICEWDSVKADDDTDIWVYENVGEWILDSYTINTIKYLCKDSNFPATNYVVANDGSVGDDICLILTDSIYRGLDGWKDLFSGATSVEECEQILVALIQDWDNNPDINVMPYAKTSQKCAKLITKSMKNYIDAYAVNYSLSSDDINKIAEYVGEEKIGELLISGKYEGLSSLLTSNGYSKDSEAVKMLDSFSSSRDYVSAVSDGLSYVGSGLKFVSISTDTVNRLYQLEALKQSDDLYSEMLLYIRDNCCYSVASEAADNLYHLIQNEEGARIGYVTSTIANDGGEEVFNTVLNEAIKEIPVAKILKGSFDLGVNLSNFLFHTSDTQKLKDSMRTLTYLNNAMSRWVLSGYDDYLKAQNDEERERAGKKIYYSTKMLFDLREKQEEVFQKMLESTGSVKVRMSDWYVVSTMVKSNLENMETSLYQYNMIADSSCISVACPVDVEIVDSDNHVLHTLKDKNIESGSVDNVVYYEENYNPLSDDFFKIIILPKDGPYSINIIGNDIGIVDFSVQNIKSDSTIETANLANLEVKKGSSVSFKNITNTDTITYSTKGLDTCVQNEKLVKKNADVQIESISTSSSNMNLNVGEKVLLHITYIPANTTETSVYWETSDKNIVSVDSDGVITGKSSGEAVVKCVSSYNTEVYNSVKIKVNTNNVGPDNNKPNDDNKNDKPDNNIINLPNNYVSIRFDVNGGEELINENKIIRIKRNTSIIELPVPKREGYVFAGWYTKKDGGNKLSRFTQINENITLYAKWIDKINSESVFPDISVGKWYKYAVDYVVSRQIMIGDSQGRFDPNKACTREMVVQILYGIAGRPNVNERENPFTDVNNSSKWYYDAILWAKQSGISRGREDGSFGIGNDITRQDVAMFLYWYAKHNGCNVEQINDLSKYEDYNMISEYSKTALGWANANNIIVGDSNGMINPKGYATRAEMAQIIMNYLIRYGD